MNELNMYMQETGWLAENLETPADMFIRYLGKDTPYKRLVVASVSEAALNRAVAEIEGTTEWSDARRSVAILSYIGWEERYQEQQAEEVEGFFAELANRGWHESMYPEDAEIASGECEECGGKTHGRGVMKMGAYRAFAVCERCGHIVEF